MDGTLMFWAFVWLASIVLAAWVMRRTRTYLTFWLIIMAWLSFPTIWVALDCKERYSSEACVWGVSLLPLYLAAALSAGAITYVVWMALVSMFRFAKRAIIKQQ